MEFGCPEGGSPVCVCLCPNGGRLLGSIRPWNAGECKGMQGECTGMPGNDGECRGVQGNAGE